MSTEKKPASTDANDLELRKVKALEKIGNSLDALTMWFEQIDQEEWGNRIQYYLAEFHNKFVQDNSSEKDSKKDE